MVTLRCLIRHHLDGKTNHQCLTAVKNYHDNYSLYAYTRCFSVQFLLVFPKHYHVGDKTSIDFVPAVQVTLSHPPAKKGKKSEGAVAEVKESQFEEECSGGRYAVLRTQTQCLEPLVKRTSFSTNRKPNKQTCKRIEDSVSDFRRTQFFVQTHIHIQRTEHILCDRHCMAP